MGMVRVTLCACATNMLICAHCFFADSSLVVVPLSAQSARMSSDAAPSLTHACTVCWLDAARDGHQLATLKSISALTDSNTRTDLIESKDYVS
jgi:hypothetical protein